MSLHYIRGIGLITPIVAIALLGVKVAWALEDDQPDIDIHRTNPIAYMTPQGSSTAWREKLDTAFPLTVNVYVANIENSAAWYRIVLDGARILRPLPSIVAFEVTNGVWLELIESEPRKLDAKPAGLGPGSTAIRFGVLDVVQEKKRLESAGVNTGDLVRPGGPGQVTMFDLLDPSGNVLGFYELNMN
jgi:predicted outer membrane lipoprotein